MLEREGVVAKRSPWLLEWWWAGMQKRRGWSSLRRERRPHAGRFGESQWAFFPYWLDFLRAVIRRLISCVWGRGWSSILAVHESHLENFKSTFIARPPVLSTQLNQIFWRWDLGTGAFYRLPGDSKVRPELRIPRLGVWGKKVWNSSLGARGLSRLEIYCWICGREFTVKPASMVVFFSDYVQLPGRDTGLTDCWVLPRWDFARCVWWRVTAQEGDFNDRPGIHQVRIWGKIKGR